MQTEQIAWVECPRDAWQGLPRVIPTAQKREHLRHLIDAGFARLDLGSFVSPKAVPQLADTEEVLAGLERPPAVDVLCIVANRRGVERAAEAAGVTSVGYPHSVSDTFQRRNVGRSLDESWALVASLAEDARARDIEFVAYVSMGFGNPYGDPWRPEDTAEAVARLRDMGIGRIALADTVGVADAARLDAVLTAIGADHPDAGLASGPGLGLHLHARPDAWQPLVDAALGHGVRWFEGALAGVGGCPFAGDALVGNLPTELVVPYLADRGFELGIDLTRLDALRDEAALLAATHA